jgi:hypothetical protein
MGSPRIMSGGVANVRDKSEVLWNVTRGEDGTIVARIIIIMRPLLSGLAISKLLRIKKYVVTYFSERDHSSHNNVAKVSPGGESSLLCLDGCWLGSPIVFNSTCLIVVTHLWFFYPSRF